MTRLALTAALLLLGSAAVAVEPSRLVPPGEPEPDCRAYVGSDRNHEMPGYLVPDARGAPVCVPFLVTANRPPEGFPATSTWPSSRTRS